MAPKANGNWSLCLAVAAALLAPAIGRGGESAWYESFEGPQPSWRVVGSDGQYAVKVQQRSDQASHTGRRSEWLQVWGNGGTFIHAEHPVGRARVIEDLRVSVWVRADRPGVELLARIVLPSTNDPRTGKPLATLITGNSYRNVGRWQELRIDELPTLLARQVRALRAQYGPQVSAQGAYLDGLMLNLYGGPGVTNVWIDDLDVAGYVPVTADAPTSAPAQPHGSRPIGTMISPHPPVAANVPAGQPGEQRPNAGWQAPTANPAEQPRGGGWEYAGPGNPAGTAGGASGNPGRWTGLSDASGSATPSPAEQPLDLRVEGLPGTSARRVQMNGSVLLVDGQPFFPRAIEYRGEPLDLLRRLGFNTIWLDQLPSNEFLAQARQADLWVVCPPPTPARLDLPEEPSPALAPLGSQYDGVLCWDLGHDLDEGQLPTVRRWAQQLRMADRAGRPLICHARTNLLAYSRAADALLLDRRPLGSSLELSQYSAWIRQQPRLARPGTPVWTTVQTQLPAEAVDQHRVLDPQAPVSAGVQPEQLRLLVYQAVAAGSRGLLVLSAGPLSADDPDTRFRAAALELLNLEMQLIEPWAAAGTLVAFVDSGDPQVSGALLRAERARLLMPMWSAPGAQYVPGQSAANNLQFTVPGLPESTLAYQLVPGHARVLKHKRVTGGTRITLDEFGLTDLVLLAHDPMIVGAIMQRTAAIGRRAAQLHLEIAATKYQRVTQLVPALAARGLLPAEANRWLLDAQNSLRRGEQFRAARNDADAYVEAARALRALRLVERSAWERATAELPSPTTSPVAVAWQMLPAHSRLTDWISSSRPGPNLLPAGEFDRLDSLISTGWCNWQRAPAGVTAKVELSAAAGRGGGFGLLLSARAESPDTAPAVLESPPIVVSSPPINVQAGQLLCVHGWVKIPAELTAGVDGLTVFDSLGGEPLAAHLHHTAGWQRVLLYRVAARSGTMQLHIVLCGLGEVHLDDFAVTAMLASPAATSPSQGLGPTADRRSAILPLR